MRLGLNTVSQQVCEDGLQFNESSAGDDRNALPGKPPQGVNSRTAFRYLALVHLLYN